MDDPDDPCDPWPVAAAKPARKFADFFREAYQRWLPPSVLLVCLLRFIYIHWFSPQAHPPVGTYISILALVAAVVTIWPPESHWSKAAWLLVFFSLTGLEISTLYRQREDDAVKEQAAKTEEDSRFAGILEHNQEEFDETMRRMQALGDLSTESVNEMTGGDSFAYAVAVNFGTGALLTIQVHGQYIVRNVLYEVMEGNPPSSPSLDSLLKGTFIRLGDISPSRMIPIDSKPIAVDPTRGAFFLINTSSLNGTFTERLHVTTGDDPHPHFCLTVAKLAGGPKNHHDRYIWTEGCPKSIPESLRDFLYPKLSVQ